MIYRSFIYEVSDGLATIRLNDPERLNALTFAAYAELERVFAAMASDSTVKVIVLTGTGKGFCSGGSVHDIIDGQVLRH
jgi:enoyl-CoA hydratase/carnithine racemase